MEEQVKFLCLPSVLIQEIAMLLDDRSLMNLELCCKKFHSIISKKDQIYKKKCLLEFPVRFKRDINPVYSLSDDTLSWKTKYILSKFFPKEMIFHKNDVDQPEGVRDDDPISSDGLTLTYTKETSYMNFISDHPFISTNPKVSSLLAPKILHKINLQGFDYFELKVLKSSQMYNRCIAFGITTKTIGVNSVVGWEADTIGFHADDGTVRRREKVNYLKLNDVSVKFEAGDVVGMGFHFNKSNFILTLNGKMIFKENQKFKPNTPYYPVVSLTVPQDQVVVNLGDTPFSFDVCQFCKETGQTGCSLF